MILGGIILKKKIISLFSLIILVGCLFGCGNMNTPKKKVQTLLSSYQNNGESIISELNDYVKTLTADDKTFEEYKKVYLRQYQDLTYEIKDETIDGDNATVTAQIEVYDYYKVNNDVNNYISTNPNDFATDGVYDTNKGLLYRIGELSKSKDRIKYTLTLNLTKVNDDWTIDNLTNEDLEKIHGTYAH